MVSLKYPQNRIEIGKMMTPPEYPEYHQNLDLTIYRKTLQKGAVFFAHEGYMRNNSFLRNKKNSETKRGEHFHFSLFRKTKITISEYM